MTSQYAQAINDTLTKPLQTLYNLNWKNTSKRPDSKVYARPSGRIEFWPTALDFTLNGKTYQVKWELDGDKVINVTFPYPDALKPLSEFLHRYLWGD